MTYEELDEIACANEMSVVTLDGFNEAIQGYFIEETPE